MTWGEGGESKDDMTTVLERGDTIYFDKTLIQNIDFFINPFKFGYFMYYKGTQLVRNSPFRNFRCSRSQSLLKAAHLHIQVLPLRI